MRSVILFWLVAVATAALSSRAGERPQPLILDMVHHNPGEPMYETRYEDPAVMKSMGYNGKVYFLFDSPTLAINWESVDPQVFPKGSPEREWVDNKAARIDQLQAKCKAAGLGVYAQCDLVLFPKKLIELRKIEKTFGDPKDPQTDQLLRAMLAQIFDRFPNLDGLVVRIGETYLHDAPYHQGSILNKTDAQKTIIPLVQLLREELCVKRGKQLIFRSWLSFDTKLETYLAVSSAVEPHPNLVLSVKHCEGDFFRGNPFSKVLGEGHHPQIIEVQCAREYEGKGAYPNYVANGVIEGFEEHRNQLPPEKIRSIRELTQRSKLFAGIWTWTRGGGWSGPYIQNELWCDLNAWVVAQWAQNPAQSEESVFNRYATEKLGLKGDDVGKFRRFCLMSADAVLRGRASTFGDVHANWSRDCGLQRPKLPTEPEKLARVMREKGEAVKLFEEMLALAESIQFPDAKTKEYVLVSTKYGLHLYRIGQAIFELVAIGEKGDSAKIREWLGKYDAAWADYRKLPQESAQCATLYAEKAGPVGPRGEGVEVFIPRFREAAK